MTPDSQNTGSHHEEGTENATQTTSTSGLPLRGLAMILIAVGVLLAAWALWSFTGGTNDEDPTAASETQTAQGGQQETSQGTSGGAPSETSGGDDADADGGADEQASENEDPDAAGGADDGDAREPGTQAAQGQPATVLHVLNNSTIQGLAAGVADQLGGEFDRVESGNLADQVLPQNTVYFNPGNPAAEQQARELADRVGGVAQQRPGNLPAETAGDNALVLVIVQETSL